MVAPDTDLSSNRITTTTMEAAAAVRSDSGRNSVKNKRKKCMNSQKQSGGN